MMPARTRPGVGDSLFEDNAEFGLGFPSAMDRAGARHAFTAQFADARPAELMRCMPKQRLTFGVKRNRRVRQHLEIVYAGAEEL